MKREETNELERLISRIEKHQKALRLNDTQFVARYQRYVRSTRTWRNRLCARAWEELLPRRGKWEKLLRAFVAEIDGGTPVAEFFERLPIARYGMALYERLQGQSTDRRCGFLLGTYGVGKTVTLRRLADADPTRTVYVRANETWRDSRMQIASALARAVGSPEEPSAAATFRGVVEYLKSSPMTVLVDEAHEGGVLLLKLVKTIIDETACKFILGTYPTAWQRLVNGSTDAVAEAQQLLGRTLKPIQTRWTQGLGMEDVSAYLESAGACNGAAATVAERILPLVRRGGNYRVLADALESARIQADEADTEMDGAAVEEAVAALVPGGGKEGRS